MSAAIRINRAPVLTMWAAVVAHRLGFNWAEALTLGRVVAGLNAYAKGKALGIFQPRPRQLQEQRKKLADGEQLHVDLLGRAAPVLQTADGLRGLSKGKAIAPESVERYLHGKFGDRYETARKAMQQLAASRPPRELAHDAYALYEAFRPVVPAGARGWGAAGDLDLARIRDLAR